MSRSTKLITALLCIVVVLLIAIPAYWYKAVTTSAGLEKTLASQLSEQLGRHVDVGSVQVKPTGKITAKDVAVEDQGQFLLRAKEIVVTYNVFYIFSSNPLTGLRSIDFYQSEIFVDRSIVTGEWNIIRFIKELKKPKQSDSFRAVLRFVDSKMFVKDKEQNIPIEKVNGEIDLSGSPKLSLHLNGLLAGKPLNVKGIMHIRNGTFSMQIDAKDQLLELIAPWCPQTDLAVKQGTADISLFFLQEQYQPLQYSGEIGLRDASAVLSSKGYQLSDVSGQVHISNKALFLQGIAGKLNGEMIRIQGNVALDGRHPYINVAITAEDLNIKKALPDKIIPIDGNIKAELSAVGSMDDLRVFGVVRMKQGAVNGIALHDGTATLAYYHNWLEIKDLQAGVWGGSVKGQGVVKLDAAPVYSALLQLEGVQSPRSELTGRITASVFLAGNDQNPLSMVWGAGQLENGSVYNIPFDKAETGFYLLNNQLQLDYFNLSVDAGWLSIQGTATKEDLHLAMHGENLPLKRLAPTLGNLPISGLGSVKGNIRGNMDDPVITGAFTAKEGKVLQQSYTECSGEFNLTKKELVLRNVSASDDKARHDLNGSIYFSPEPMLDLHIVSKQASAEEVAKLLGFKETIRGRVDNEVVVRGSLKKPELEGRILLTQGEYREQRIDRVQVTYTFRNGVLELQNCTAISGGASLELAGTLGTEQELDFHFAAKNLRFEELNVLKSLPYGISGRAEFSGTIKGVWANPRISSSVKAYDTVINNQRFGNLTGKIEFIDKQLLVPELKMIDGAACYDFLGKVDFNDPPQVEGLLTVREGQVPQLLGLLSYAIPDAQGKVTADLTLSGPLFKPDARGRLTVTQGYVKGYPVDIIDLDVVAEKGLITFNTLELKQGQGFLRAQGTWSLDGVIGLEVGAKNIDAGFVAALLPNPQPVKGIINFTAQIAGTTQNPQAAVSVEIRQGSWANAEFDSLYALLLLENDIIKLNQLMLVKSPYRASAYGTIPLAALTQKGREEPNSPTGMDIRVQLEEADLSILPLLSQNVAWAVGQTHGQVRIGGNLYQPLIFGQFSVADGSVKFRGFNNLVEHANIKLEFDGDTINLKTFNGQLGGGNYTGNGSATIKGFSLRNLHLALNLDKLYVNSKYYVGTLEGNFTVEEVRGLPLLKGGLHIANAQISPPVFWPEVNNALPNVRLDVEIEADKNVRLRNSALYDMYIKGKVKAEGTLDHPITSGRLTVVRGSLQYLSTSFRITEGVADFNQYESFLPNISVMAETRVLDTKVRLQAKGPLSQMDFRFASEPSLSQEQIITLLTLRSRNTGGTGNGGGETDAGKNQMFLLLNEGLQFAFVQRMEKVMENFLGLDEFHIVRSQNETVADREMYNLEVGKFITDKIFLGYTMGIDQSEKAIRFRYDITNNLSLDGELGDKINKRIGLAARFYF
jgi:translocation and assembly module TamB